MRMRGATRLDRLVKTAGVWWARCWNPSYQWQKEDQKQTTGHYGQYPPPPAQHTDWAEEHIQRQAAVSVLLDGLTEEAFIPQTDDCVQIGRN